MIAEEIIRADKTGYSTHNELGLLRLGQKAQVEIQSQLLWPKPNPMQAAGFSA